jgi:hypothetical protein
VYRYNSTVKGGEDKKKKRFVKIEGLTMKSNIVFVKGSKNMVLIGMANSFEVLLINFHSTSIETKLRNHEPNTEIVGGGFDGQDILIFTRDRFRKCSILK